jgi:hypothetical protein
MCVHMHKPNGNHKDVATTTMTMTMDGKEANKRRA